MVWWGGGPNEIAMKIFFNKLFPLAHKTFPIEHLGGELPLQFYLRNWIQHISLLNCPSTLVILLYFNVASHDIAFMIWYVLKVGDFDPVFQYKKWPDGWQKIGCNSFDSPIKIAKRRHWRMYGMRCRSFNGKIRRDARETRKIDLLKCVTDEKDISILAGFVYTTNTLTLDAATRRR